MHSDGFLRFTKDTNSASYPLLIDVIIYTGTAAGDSVALYDGQDATSGRLMCTIKTIDAYTHQLIFTNPLRFENGIFADFSTNMLEVTIIFRPNTRLNVYNTDLEAQSRQTGY